MANATMRGSGSHLAYSELRRKVLTLELQPGSRLSEESLATSLGVSRTPLREAVRQLVSESLLERLPTGGLVVPQLNQTEISELYDVRASLELLMAGEAASRATAADIEELEGIVARNAAMVDFPDDAMRYGQALHSALADIAGNDWAVRLHAQVSSQMERYRRFTNHSAARRQSALEQHRALVRLVADGDVEGARRMAFQHVIDARDEALRAIGANLD
ncbi:GntR family transcriptional regulator [Microbacterium sp. LWO14-1.2]|uniref:GntR family transcriptional regulator n=1 Tax=unclassified Microbacterium TaxID=2609290 RepID=UPI003139D0E9